ncbi:hypothetical protein [Brevibacillus laterosporus]|uniref:hypothetical protein n=1 Tax=Brevibacillus laterosporus TaxID=1465 RepID=UPI00215C598D|nr:hypothetical protein [Brevibacillus laterosporus]MCR8996861.1 hypothetical protein [Brevibacillus laterosporus]
MKSKRTILIPTVQERVLFPITTLCSTVSQNDDLEVVRQKLVELFIQEGYFSSPEVLQLS